MQKIIIEKRNSDNFEKYVQELMDKGWKAVPGTHVAIQHTDSAPARPTFEATFGYFSIVLEKD